MGESKVIRDVLKERGVQYERADVLANEMLRAVSPAYFERLLGAGVYYHWFQILGKLCRAAINPMRQDTWTDIVGYAQLALDRLKENE